MESSQSTKPADSSRQKHWRQLRPEPKEQSLHTFRSNDIEPNSDASIDIQNYRFLASYNWSKSKEPVIFVPGQYIC